MHPASTAHIQLRARRKPDSETRRYGFGMAPKQIVGYFNAVILRLLLVSLLLISSACQSENKARIPYIPTDARVLAFGDSLTYGTGVSEENSYPVVLRELINREVIRSGVPGEVSASGLPRLKEDLEQYQPKLVILIHGGNDTLRRQNANDTYNNLRKMIAMIQSHGSTALLVGVPGFSLNLSGPSAAPQYQTLADELSIPYDGDTLPALLYDKAFKSDTVHLNAAGYRRLAEGLAELIKDSGGL